MLKVFLNRKPLYDTAWGGGNMWCQAFHRHASEFGVEITNDVLNTDIIVLVGLDRGDTGVGLDEACYIKKLSMVKDIKIVTRVNENDARKHTSGVDSYMLRAMMNSRCVICVSEWIKGYYVKKASDDFYLKSKIENSFVVHNGVDEKLFCPNSKFDNGKINIVTHHWSNNYLKGFDVYDQLDSFVVNNEKFTFTYIGRERGTFKNTNVVKPLFGKALGIELGKYDVYVSASRWDPGPNSILEGISCGLPTYVHKDGGGSVEIAGLDHVYDDWIDLKQLLCNGKFVANKTRLLDWRKCIKQYCEFIFATCST